MSGKVTKYWQRSKIERTSEREEPYRPRSGALPCSRSPLERKLQRKLGHGRHRRGQEGVGGCIASSRSGKKREREREKKKGKTRGLSLTNSAEWVLLFVAASLRKMSFRNERSFSTWIPRPVPGSLSPKYCHGGEPATLVDWLPLRYLFFIIESRLARTGNSISAREKRWPSFEYILGDCRSVEVLYKSLEFIIPEDREAFRVKTE